MPSRVRVLPPISTRGITPLSFALGIAYAAVVIGVLSLSRGLIEFFFGPAMQSSGMIVVLCVFTACISVVPAVCAWWFTRLCQSAWRLLLAGIALGLGAALASTVIALCSSPSDLLQFFVPDSLAFGMVASVGMSCVVFFPLLGMIVFGIVVAAVRLAGTRNVLQTGSLCWRCAYELGDARLGRCPECGDVFSPESTPTSIGRTSTLAVWRLGWWIAGAAVFAAFMPVVWTISTHTLPSLRFSRAASPPYRSRQVFIQHFVGQGTPDAHFAETSTGWWLPDSPGATTGITVQYAPRARSGDPRIFVSRAFIDTSFWPSGMPDSGTPRITAQLSEVQARQVIATGELPKGLIGALLDEADKQSWAQTTFSGAIIDHLVDPSPYFAPAQKP